MEAYPSGNNYIWSNGSTASYIENLSPGAYSVTVTDSNGCTDSSNGIINQSIALNNSNSTFYHIHSFATKIMPCINGLIVIITMPPYLVQLISFSVQQLMEIMQ